MKQIRKQLIYGEVLAEEIRLASEERKNKRKGLRNIVSGKILKKYKFLKFTAIKLKTDRRQLSRTTSKLSLVTRKERKKNEEIVHSVQEFFYRDDVSTALSGKRDAKKVGRNLLQRQVLNDYLSNLYIKFVAENPSTKLSFSKFARMRPSHFNHHIGNLVYAQSTKT